MWAAWSRCADMAATYDIAIIGGGAAGALAALGARSIDRSLSILILEKEERRFRKIGASGNGRCNLLNECDIEGRYHGSDPTFVRGALYRMTAADLRRYFASIGLLTLLDREGRVYPRSMQSRSVIRVLERALGHAGVMWRAPVTVTDVTSGDDFILTTEDGDVIRARSVVIACGGPAAPNLGGSSSGLTLLRSLGHAIVPPRPALVPLTLADHPLTAMAAGVRFRGRAAVDDTVSEGEFLITDYGLSGIAAMELGRAVAMHPGTDATVEIHFLPECTEDEILMYLMAGRDDLPTALAGLVPENIGRALLASEPKDMSLERLAHRLTSLSVPVRGTRGFEFAQVTAGGAATDGFDPTTMMSDIVPGLFAAGEVLDIDGDTGGFNLMWAFASGWLAGESAARRLRNKREAQ